ncbi:hypothetical protein B9Z19DRAFT_1071738 [Tuber borchii]|uniref:Uncharacterized protein n=1 Tax=Tuber borchii TaxID=42251 RepID=A0A2T7A7V7_TUBBO|nr:hypothetical protein B9Z19DRAFT_1071738 [Tuber borchii]
MHNQSATHPQPCHSCIHHPWESSNPKVCIIMRRRPTPLFGKTTTMAPVCSASICKLSPLLSTFVPFFLILLPYSLIRNHHPIYLLALMATHSLFFLPFPFLLACLLSLFSYSICSPSFPPFLRIHWKWRGGKTADCVGFFHLLFFFFSSLLFFSLLLFFYMTAMTTALLSLSYHIISE